MNRVIALQEGKNFQEIESYQDTKRKRAESTEHQSNNREEDMSQRQRDKDTVRVGSLCWCGSTCFLSVIIIALCVPLCEKRGRRSDDVTRGTAACYCHYRGNSNIPFNTLKNTYKQRQTHAGSLI